MNRQDVLELVFILIVAVVFIAFLIELFAIVEKKRGHVDIDAPIPSTMEEMKTPWIQMFKCEDGVIARMTDEGVIDYQNMYQVHCELYDVKG